MHRHGPRPHPRQTATALLACALLAASAPVAGATTVTLWADQGSQVVEYRYEYSGSAPDTLCPTGRSVLIGNDISDRFTGMGYSPELDRLFVKDGSDQSGLFQIELAGFTVEQGYSGPEPASASVLGLAFPDERFLAQRGADLIELAFPAPGSSEMTAVSLGGLPTATASCTPAGDGNGGLGARVGRVFTAKDGRTVLWELDPDDASVIAALPLPLCAGPGLAFDGQCLFLSDVDAAVDVIHRVDPDTGDVLGSASLGTGLGADALAVSPASTTVTLWADQGDRVEEFRYTYTVGAADSISATRRSVLIGNDISDRFTGMGYSPELDRLFVKDGSDQSGLFQIELAGFTVEQGYSGPEPASASVLGLAFPDERFLAQRGADLIELAFPVPGSSEMTAVSLGGLPTATASCTPAGDGNGGLGARAGRVFTAKDGRTVLWEVDPDDASVIAALPLPLCAGPGLAFDGQCLFLSDVDATVDVIHRVDPDTGDLLGSASLGTGLGADALAVGSHQGSWVDLGGGAPGAAGQPTLTMGGSLADESCVTLALTDGAPHQLAVLFVSVVSTPAPFLGGTLHAFPFVVLSPLMTDGAGAFQLSAYFPGGDPGQSLWVQVGVNDPSVVPAGASLSNAVRGTLP